MSTAKAVLAHGARVIEQRVDALLSKRRAGEHGTPLTDTLKTFSIVIKSSAAPTKVNPCVAPLAMCALLNRFTTRAGCPPGPPGLMSNALSTCPL